MKKRLSIIFICVLMLVLSGCHKEVTASSDSFKLYYLNAEGNGLYAMDYLPTSDSAETLTNDVIGMLKTSSEKMEYKAPIKEDTFDRYEIANSQVLLYFNEQYRQLDPISEVLMRASCVKTLGQIEDVTGVCFFVSEEPLCDAYGNPIGVMTPEQFITNAGNEINAYEKTKINLYFADETGNELIPVQRTVVYSSNISLERIVVDELIKGPLENEIGFGTVNPEVSVISTTVTDGICYVNLSGSFLSKPLPMSPEVTIYSLVNSLVELPGVNKVVISVDGESNIRFLEKIDLSQAFERNLDILSAK